MGIRQSAQPLGVAVGGGCALPVLGGARPGPRRWSFLAAFCLVAGRHRRRCWRVAIGAARSVFARATFALVVAGVRAGRGGGLVPVGRRERPDCREPSAGPGRRR